MLRYLSLFALAFISLLATIIPSLQEETSPADIAVVLQYLSGALALQIVLLIFIRRFVGVKSSILLAAVLTALNALALSLSFSGHFLALPHLGKIAVLPIIAAVAFLLYWASYQRPRFGLVAAGLYLAVILTQFIGLIAIDDHGASKLAAPNLPQGVQPLKFRHLPNVYIVSVDSMIPEKIAGKHLGDRFSRLEYANYLRSAGALIFQNVFADRVPTKQSLNALLNLSIAPYTDDKTNRYNYFSGKSDSIVYRIFRENGYRISSGFAQASYFGQKGRYVDEYISSNLPDQRFPFCEFRLRWYYAQFLGFCSAADAVMEKNDTADQSGWPARVLATIKDKASDRGSRWLSFYYIYQPIGHTDLDFSISDKKALMAYGQYFENQTSKLTLILKEFVSTVRSNDPDGIIFIFGDHGPWLSRDVRFESDQQFWVQDRHGVFAAVVGNPKCPQGHKFPSNREFTTPSLILSGLLSCISGDNSMANIMPGQKWEHDFSRYRYE